MELIVIESDSGSNLTDDEVEVIVIDDSSEDEDDEVEVIVIDDSSEDEEEDGNMGATVTVRFPSIGELYGQGANATIGELFWLRSQFLIPTGGELHFNRAMYGIPSHGEILFNQEMYGFDSEQTVVGARIFIGTVLDDIATVMDIENSD
jgi:hypothetical protein